MENEKIMSESGSSENLKLLYGFPVHIPTEEEHKNAYYNARARHKIRIKQDIEQHKRELARAREQLTILKAVIKATRKEKYMLSYIPYDEWVRKQREEYKGYKIIENKDSIKIKDNPAYFCCSCRKYHNDNLHICERGLK